MGWQISIAPSAEQDLSQVIDFIALDSPKAAEKIGAELIHLMFSLNDFPHRGPTMRGQSIRRLIHRNYLVIYRLDEAKRLVEIVRVWDARQDPAKLTFGRQ